MINITFPSKLTLFSAPTPWTGGYGAAAFLPPSAAEGGGTSTIYKQFGVKKKIEEA